MIGIHFDGRVCWFDFPHTLESQEQLVARLEREAMRGRDSFKYNGRIVGQAITDSRECGNHHLVEMKIT